MIKVNKKYKLVLIPLVFGVVYFITNLYLEKIYLQNFLQASLQSEIRFALEKEHFPGQHVRNIQALEIEDMKLVEVTQRKIRVECVIEYDSNVGKHDEVINVVLSISDDLLGHPSLSVVEIGGSEGIVAPKPIQ